MRTVDIDLDGSASLSGLLSRLRDEHVHAGDHLRLFSSKPQSDLDSFALLMIVFHVLDRLFATQPVNEARARFGDQVVRDLFGRYTNAEELELDLEKEFGVEISILARGDEDADWLRLSAGNLARAYGEHEPDYSASDVKEPNPHYRQKD